MASERLHIVPHDDGWALKPEGASKIESVYPTQKDAIDAGRDVARQDEVDLVVHRQDGTFRNVLTYTNEPMSETKTTTGKRVEAHDLYSVGSRVSWGAIVAGASVALALNAVLWLGGAALGITVSENMAPRTLTVAAALWMLFSTLASLFVGGFVVSRLTAREECSEAILYGVILWGFLFALSLGLSATGASAVGQMANFGAVTSGDNYLNRDTARMTQAEIDRLQNKMRTAREEAGGLSPHAAAWWAFAALVLSMGAAVCGSWLGSGPDFFLVQRRTPATTTTTQVPAT